MKMTIKRKLYAGFFAVLLLLGATIAISNREISSIDATYSDLIDVTARKVSLTKDMLLDIRDEQVALRGYLLLGDPSYLQDYQDANKQFDADKQKIASLIKTAQGNQLFQRVVNLENQYNQIANQLFDYKTQDKTKEISDTLMGPARTVTEQITQAANDLAKYQQDNLDKGNQDTSARVVSIKNWVLAIGIITLIIGLVVAYVISRIISKPVVAMAGIAQKIANGDLTEDMIQVKNRDEIGELANAFSSMLENLRHLIMQIRVNAEQVAASSEQLTASAQQTNQATEQVAETMQQVAAGSEKQVQSLHDTTNIINEMSMTTQQIAASAQDVSQSAVQAAEVAQSGSQSVHTAIQQMNSINDTIHELADVIKGLGERSKEIGQIVQVISEITSQTSLLALNAAIEAARAGEHGRGFAVVADEVRKLAEQSAQSAKQITELITAIQTETGKAIQAMEISMQEVTEGTDVIHSAGESFEKIQQAVSGVAAQVQEVTAAVEEMSAGSQQVVDAIRYVVTLSEEAASGTQTVSAATEEQLASMEEITASAMSLSQMAEELHQLVEAFRVHQSVEEVQASQNQPQSS
jgi:methyl-accepting chemotaxis protein